MSNVKKKKKIHIFIKSTREEIFKNLQDYDYRFLEKQELITIRNVINRNNKAVNKKLTYLFGNN